VALINDPVEFKGIYFFLQIFTQISNKTQKVFQVLQIYETNYVNNSVPFMIEF